jgi:8-oxo-dGTP diphosphatase
MPRAQCIVYRENKLLMAKHRDQGVEWWCLPGGGVENGETPAEAALRELYEECSVEGAIVRQTSYLDFGPGGTAYTFLVDIGDQEVSLGSDPEFQEDNQALVDVQWLALHEIPERDRAFLWAAGLLGVGSFLKEVEGWGDAISFPGNGPDRS